MVPPLERRYDAAVHLIGGAAAAAALPALLGAVIWRGAGHGSTILTAAIYAGGVVAMLGFSAAYNLVTDPAWRDALRKYDRAAIFLMIAGTYTPILAVGVGGRTGQGLLIVVWLAALIGAGITIARPRDHVSPIPYLILGWIGVLAAHSIIAALPVWGLALIVVGAVLYTLGVLFHRWTDLHCHNAVWHGFVLAGAGCHYAAVWQALMR